MVGIAPIAIWMYSPAAFAVVAVLTLLAIYGFQLRGTTKRFALLRWGQVARVTGTQILSQGTYYSGTTWHNAPLPVAHGWKVIRPLYSGPSTKTRIHYTVNGSEGELVVRGREYYDGVVLADPRKPARALCVTSFAYDLDRDESGNWIGRIRPRLKVGMAVWLIVVIGWLGLAAIYGTTYGDRTVGWLCTHGLARGVDCSKYTSSSSGNSSAVISVPQGGNLDVRGSYSETRKTVACNDGNLTLSGSGVISVTGHCASLTVSAWDAQVHVESADTINVSGYNNTVTYHSGSPEITQSGSNITIQQG